MPIIRRKAGSEVPDKKTLDGPLTPQEREKIAAVLTARGATRPCSRCGNTTFSVEGYVAERVISDLRQIGTLHLGGPVIPTIIVVCGNCGALTYHAIGVLDLLPDRPTEEQK